MVFSIMVALVALVALVSVAMVIGMVLEVSTMALWVAERGRGGNGGGSGRSGGQSWSELLLRSFDAGSLSLVSMVAKQQGSGWTSYNKDVVQECAVGLNFAKDEMCCAQIKISYHYIIFSQQSQTQTQNTNGSGQTASYNKDVVQECMF